MADLWDDVARIIDIGWEKDQPIIQGGFSEYVPIDLALPITIGVPQTNIFLPTQVDYSRFIQTPLPVNYRQTFVPTPLAQAPPNQNTANLNFVAAEQNRLQTYLGNIPVVGPTITKGIEMAAEVLDFAKNVVGGAVSNFLGTGEGTAGTEVAPIPGGVGAQFDREGLQGGIPRGGLALILPGVVSLATRTGLARTRIIRMIVAALGIMTIEEAADHFGLSISEIARAYIYGRTRRRRRSRGISAADMRQTQSTLGKVSRINCLIKKGSRPTRCC